MNLNELTLEQKRKLAWNSNTPPETLTLLANDENCWVRSYVAKNPNIPQYVKDYLIAKNFIESYLINLR